jgi:hypothetical protein
MIVYFNHAKLQLIPGSHLERCMSAFRAVGAFVNNRQVIDVKPGDAVLFQSSMLHGGKFDGLEKARTIVQCFDVFPNLELATEGLKCMRHVRATEEDVTTSRAVARIMNMPVIKGPMELQAFIIQAGGNGYASGHRLTDDENVDEISGEAWRPRLPDECRKDGTYCRANLYVVYDENNLMVDCDEDERRKIRKKVYFDVPLYYVGSEAIAVTTVSIVLFQAVKLLSA